MLAQFQRQIEELKVALDVARATSGVSGGVDASEDSETEDDEEEEEEEQEGQAHLQHLLRNITAPSDGRRASARLQARAAATR